MDSASEKGALLQGLCPGISCGFNTCVQFLNDCEMGLVSVNNLSVTIFVAANSKVKVAG